MFCAPKVQLVEISSEHNDKTILASVRKHNFDVSSTMLEIAANNVVLVGNVLWNTATGYKSFNPLAADLCCLTAPGVN